MHEIRFCRNDELILLQDFLAKYWSKNHVLVSSSKLLLWQHFNAEDKTINFVVAFNKKKKEFDAILGFIPSGQFDENLRKTDIWLAIWKVKEEFASTGIGLQVLMFLTNKYKPSSIGISGASEDAMKIYRAFGYKTGLLRHFYIKNDSLDNYKIAKFDKFKNFNLPSNPSLKIKKISAEEFLNANISYQYSPLKTKKYFINRYLKNPFYEYIFNSIQINKKIVSVFIARKIIVNNNSCFRIVDWIGEFQKNMNFQFQDFLEINNAEYIDLMCKTPNDEEIIEMGFIEKNLNVEVIPNFFEPFLKKNIDILYAYKAKHQNYAFFKADSDQDRPNMI